MHTVPVMCRRGLGRLIALAAVVGLCVMSAPASWAAPDDPDTAVDSPTLALTDLGYAAVMTFWGQEATMPLSVPVPRGLTPAALNATVQLPLNMRSGIITVTQGERTISKVNLPATDQAPIVIPLAGAEVTDNSVAVTVHTYLQQSEGNNFCDWGNPLRLFNGTVSFTGVEQPPATVARFLPPVLRKLSIYLPPSPSTAESEAAIRLAAAASARYGRQAPEIVVVPLPEGQTAPPTRSGPLEREVVIKEGSDSGLSLQGSAHRWLLVSGPLGQTDESDMAVLFSDLSGLAASSKVSVESSSPTVRLPGDTATLRELGLPFANATMLQPRVSIGLDQTRWGRSVHSVRVHLLGSYTAPGNIGGQIVASVGQETIDHWATDGQGVIDRWVDVPDRLLQRYTNLDLMLAVSANAGPCGDFTTFGAGSQQLTLSINGDSTVQSSPAAPPVPDGLRSMPQALLPKVQVGIEPHSLNDTVRAINIIGGLQRMSSIPIEIAVTSVQQAIDSPNPAILIAADGWNHSDVVLPVAAGPSGPITVNALESGGKPTKIELDPTVRFASLQTVFNRGRSLLVATSNGASAQLDELLAWLNSDSKHWEKLTGVAEVFIPGQDPVSVDRPPGSPVAGAEGGHSDLSWLWWFGAAWLAVAAIGAVVIVLRGRRSRR